MIEEEKREARGKKRRKGNREARKKGKRENGEGKEGKGKIVEENLKLKGERYENDQQRIFFFFFFACHFLRPLKFVWGVQK